MARVTQAQLQRINAQSSVEQLIRDLGTALRQDGDFLLGRCPFCDDCSESLVVEPGSNRWRCRSCAAAGNPVDWLVRRKGISVHHAVELLRGGCDATSRHAELACATESGAGNLACPVQVQAGEQELLDQVIDYYHRTLLASPEALAYLERRGIGSRELIEAHRLGFANRTLGLRLPPARLKGGAALRGRLQKLGLLRASGHEHFNGCLVVPTFDAAGHVLTAYGRKITENVNPPLHIHLPGVGRGVWNATGLAGQTEAILTWGLIDAMTLWCAGWRNVTAANGPDGLVDEHLEALQRFGVRRVLIAFGREGAGEQAASQATEWLLALGLECLRLPLPRGMNVNEFARRQKPADKSLGLLMRKAVWVGKGTPPLPAPAPVNAKVVPAAESAAAVQAAIAAAIAPVSCTTPKTVELDVQSSMDEVVMSFDERRYRVRGLARNLSAQTLKVNILIGYGAAYFVDSFDLYSARSRANFVAQAARELTLGEETVKTDLGRLLLRLEEVQAERIRAALQVEPQVPRMTEGEQAEALELLRSPDLLARIVSDLEACGLVGEATNKLAAYLAATSRKLDEPLAIVVQSSSAAGKSSLMDAVLAFMPEEECVRYSAVTGQSLFYMGRSTLKHKILAISEQYGARRAAYALKLLQSDGELTIASTGKNAATGALSTQEYRVEGPVAICLTTTAVEIDEELLSRCLVLSVDEGRSQTEAIHRRQRERRTLPGLKTRQQTQRIGRLHRNAQRLLRPVAVVNPFADRLTFLTDKTRTRRDHEKYLTLIETIALLHQHQRPVRTVVLENGEAMPYVEVIGQDIAQANRVAHEVLGRSLDVLPPQTRRLLGDICQYVQARGPEHPWRRPEVLFTRRQLREAIGWGDTQLRLHLGRLLELEYLLAHHGGRGQRYEYELAFDGDLATAAPQLSGLINAAALQHDDTTAASRGAKPRFATPSRGTCGALSAGSRTVQSAANPAPQPVSRQPPADSPEIHFLPPQLRCVSYLHDGG